MTAHARAYRLLTGLYPRSFRREFAADLVQAFSDVARQQGAAAAWRRSCIDLAVTVPLYHLEALMHRSATSPALVAMVLVLALAGLAALALGSGFALPLLGIAFLAGVAQRTELARSLVAAPGQRRASLRIAGGLAFVFIAAVASWAYHVGRYDSLGGTTVLVHNAIGVLSLVGAVAFGLAALRTREAPATS